MDINNNQQINTFTKGMDTDTSDMYIGEGSYRYAENLRVVTDKDGNTGELHLIEGTTKILNHKKDPQYIGTEQLLGFTSIRQYIIEVVKRGDTWGIYRSDTAGQRQLVAGWFDKLIWPDDWDDKNGKMKPLSLVTRWEADDNVKLYIASNYSEILSINIAELNQGGDFEKVFQITKVMLEPIKATVTKKTGASMPGVTLQYAYIVYKVHGLASTMSTLSNIVVQPDDYTHGYATDAKGAKTVKLEMPSDIIGKRVKVYRIAYSKAGQLPRVDVIYNQECQQTVIYDSGLILENVSTAEFLATNKLLFNAKELESKGDYLFAANVKYSQDKIDETFADFDARCYSTGSYYIQDGQRYDIDISNLNTYINLSKDIDLHHDLFGENLDVTYKPEYWQEVNGANGRGKCFEWKYKFNEYFLGYLNQYGDADSSTLELANVSPRTYARNEVYRFGVRLFDKNGNASSVKWIADIKMPDYVGNNAINDYFFNSSAAFDVEDNVSVNTISIEFKPINTNMPYWNGVYKYEIVLAKRSIEDSYKVAQGIFGFPTQVSQDELCLPYFLTTSRLAVKRGLANNAKSLGQLLYQYRSVAGLEKSKEYDQYLNALIFASPEYTYQPDDILAILKQNKEGLQYKVIGWWSRLAEFVKISAQQAGDPTMLNELESTSNSVVYTDRTVLKYRSELLCNSLDIPKNNDLCPDGSDLRIQLGTNLESPNYLGQYCISNQTMNCNTDELVFFEPLRGGGEYSAKKRAYFTNMYPQNRASVANAYPAILIKNVTYVDIQPQESFARDESPSYKSEFKTLHNGLKFYNWTNPALFDNDVYNSFNAGGDTTIESFRHTTMTSYNDSNINAKDWWTTDGVGGAYLDLHAMIGSYALAFPTASGGPSMILEFDQELLNLLGSSYMYDESTKVASMPLISVGNIYKKANPYGGYYKTAIDNTQYISCGEVKNKTQSVVMNHGDNYITMFAYCLYHCFDNAQHNAINTACTQYIVPIESTVDLARQASNYVQAYNNDTIPVKNKGNGIWVQAKPTTLSGRFTLTTDMYMYNTAYSVLPDIVTYAGQDTVNTADSLYDSRIHYSQKKQNNELIDNWTSFKAIDYLDVDSRYGQITGLKLFKDKLIFLQENGAGVLSVNDRIILKDQESANIIVGNGGVLDRYDYFTTIYGMKPDQHVVEATNDALYWWDGHRREILGYTDGYNIALLLRIKNVQNYINNGAESDTPSIICDANNKEVLFNVVNNESLVYNEQIQQFTSVYTFNPIYYCNIDGIVYLTDDWSSEPNLYEYNTSDDEAQLFEKPAKPSLKYVVNKDPIYNKVFDVQTFGGRFYGGDDEDLVNLNLDYKTPLKQHSRAEHGEGITNREYDYRLAIPRNNDDLYGGRMRGKTMECEITSDSNNKDFSIQYVTTKYRMSWT